MTVRQLPLVLCALLLATGTEARELTDMVGRRVVVPDRIGKVVALAPPATHLVYAIDPSLLAGVNFPLWEREKRFTVESYRHLPVIGGMVGGGRTVNMEVLLRIRPDVAIVWTGVHADSAWNGKYEQMLGQLGVPVVYARFEALQDYPAALLFMGELLDRRQRAAALHREAVAVLDRIASLPKGERTSVYYAESDDCLATEGELSWHAEAIRLAGGRNVRPGTPRTLNGRERISFEQVLLYDPDVILVEQEACLTQLLASPRWKDLRAVRDRKLFLIPQQPFNWFDRPPGFMRLLGVQWLANLLHPERLRIDVLAETRRFYRLFLGVELSEAEAREILHWRKEKS